MMAGIITARTGAAGLPVEQGYTIGFAVLAVALLCAGIAGLAVPNLHTQDTGGRLADADNAELGYVAAAPADVRGR
ncbi:hypothetical protein [Nocardioides sp. TF02-7]|uniref:hypothetical protein n=1 Tax=Nocardioides sp. TF02-7 TaxID=2917724 RepID=UPI001F061762|nr:hypothetical protein [Nocardioides sp. TF02-7]UMG91661.1 hypothetical protein MF408_16445 [Nocardioides sp. TF02-7]